MTRPFTAARTVTRDAGSPLLDTTMPASARSPARRNRGKLGRAIRRRLVTMLADVSARQLVGPALPRGSPHAEIDGHLLARQKLLLARLHVDPEPASLRIDRQLRISDPVAGVAHALRLRLRRPEQVHGDEGVRTKVVRDRHRDRRRGPLEGYPFGAVDASA